MRARGRKDDGMSHLCRSCVVFERVHCQAEDVVVVTEVEPLAVLQPVVDDSHGGHVVDHLPSLSVEQVVATVEAPVPVGVSVVSEEPEAQGERRKDGRFFTREQTADEVPPPGLSAASGNQPASSAAEAGPPYTPGDGTGGGRVRRTDRWTGWFQHKPLTWRS